MKILWILDVGIWSFRPLSGGGSFDLVSHAGGVGFEVFVKEAGQLFGGGVVGGFIGPGLARPENFRRDTGHFGDNVEAEDGILFRFWLVEGRPWMASMMARVCLRLMRLPTP